MAKCVEKYLAEYITVIIHRAFSVLEIIIGHQKTGLKVLGMIALVFLWW